MEIATILLGNVRPITFCAALFNVGGGRRLKALNTWGRNALAGSKVLRTLVGVLGQRLVGLRGPHALQLWLLVDELVRQLTEKARAAFASEPSRQVHERHYDSDFDNQTKDKIGPATTFKL